MTVRSRTCNRVLMLLQNSPYSQDGRVRREAARPPSGGLRGRSDLPTGPRWSRAG